MSDKTGGKEMIAGANIPDMAEQNRSFVAASGILTGTVILAGALLSAVFWSTWHAVSGFIPKICGISRLWLDMAIGPCILVMVYHLLYCLNQEDDLSNHGLCDVTLKEFAREHPFSALFGLFLVADFVASIFWSFAMGVLGIVALAAIISLGYAILYFGGMLFFLYSSMPDYEEGDSD